MSHHDQPVAPNILDGRFTAEKPNQRWVGDTTELVTGNGKLFLVILDLFSKYGVAGRSRRREKFPTNAADEEAVFDYIDVFYNQQRRYSANGHARRRTRGSSAVLVR